MVIKCHSKECIIVRGWRQSSPPYPSGQSHLPLNSLQPAYWAQVWAGRRQLKLQQGQNRRHEGPGGC